MNTFRFRFLAVFRRELHRMVTHKDLRTICFAAPLLYGFLLSSVYWDRRVQEVPVGVVDQDQSKLSRTFIRWLDATQNVRVEYRYEDAATALRDMRDEKISALLYFPKDFSRDIKHGKQGFVSASVNSANIVVANPVMTSVMEVAGTLSAGGFIKYLRKTGAVRERAISLNQAAIANPRPVFNPLLNYSDFFIPGLLFVVLQQIIIVGLAFSVAEERENGRGPELIRLSGGNRLALYLGKALPYALVNFGISIFFVAAVMPAFGLAFKGAAGWAVGLPFIALFVASVTAFGVLISAFFKSVLNALIALMFFSLPAFLISGFAWPAFALPSYLQWGSYLIPSTLFLREFRLLVLGDVPAVYLLDSALAMTLFTALCTAGTFYLFGKLIDRHGY